MRLALTLLLVLAAIGAGAQETLENPNYTAPEGRPLEGLRICVDPGHGGQIWGATRGYTGGTRSRVSSQTESEANLRVGLFLWDLLTQAGAEVVMTRTFETRLSADTQAPPGTPEYQANRREELNIRVRVAEANDCDLFVSIHHNAGGGPNTNFSTAFYYRPPDEPGPGEVPHAADDVELSQRLAQRIVDKLDERLGLGTRPARHGNYHVLRENPLPAVLVECSFMSNRAQSERMENLAYSRIAAIAIFEGILEVCGERPPVEEEPQPAEASVDAQEVQP